MNEKRVTYATRFCSWLLLRRCNDKREQLFNSRTNDSFLENFKSFFAHVHVGVILEMNDRRCRYGNIFKRFVSLYKYKKPSYNMNCTPFVRQHDILSNKWGAVHHLSKAFMFSDQNFDHNRLYL